MSDSGDCTVGSALGGIEDLASAVVSLPTFLALLAVFFAAIQGFLALESVDPCRISSRKMNMLLAVELAELIVSLTSELLSFFELRGALKLRLKWLHWVAPCLLAAGILETLVDLYFTLAVVTKSRVGWIPFSAVGAKSSNWETAPFLLTFILSLALVGWRLRWWWRGSCQLAVESMAVAQAESALKRPTVGFAVGWAVAVSSLAFIIILLSDFSEDGAHYIASLPYLWKPDQWLSRQHGDIKTWYRTWDNDDIVLEYVSTAVLDGNVEVPKTANEVYRLLEQKPLHCGNAIVGHDRAFSDREDTGASRLHKVVLIAEHLVVLPLLIVVVVIVSRMHEDLDKQTFDALRQLTDGVIILAFLEIAIGIKNLLWSISGTSRKERGTVSTEKRLIELRDVDVENARVQQTSATKAAMILGSTAKGE